jgi:hypothetical protein
MLSPKETMDLIIDIFRRAETSNYNSIITKMLVTNTEFINLLNKFY